MASAPKQSPSSVVCPSCGVTNAPVPASGRCISCGATMEQLKSARTAEQERARRYQQDGFQVLWLIISLLVQGVLTAAIIVGLPMVIPALDFEGSAGMVVSIPVWFLGGALLGMISPGRTFLEPVVASFIVAIPTVFHLAKSQTVRTMPVFMYVVMATIGVLFTLIGTYLGERIQMGPPPKRAD